MILHIIGVVMMLLAGGTSIATWLGGPGVFEFLIPDMSSYLKIILSPVTGTLYFILDTIQRNQVGLLWYGLLIFILSLLLYHRGIRTRGRSKAALFANLFFHVFALTGLTGFVYHLFTDFQPMTVVQLAEYYQDKLILWPWNVASGLESAFIQHRVGLLIAAAVSLAVYIALVFAEDHAESAANDLPYVLSYVVPVLFTLAAGSFIVKNVLGYPGAMQVIKAHPFFQAFESRADFAYYRVIAVYLLCAITSFGLMRTWLDYAEVYTGNTVTSLLVAAGAMLLLLSAAVALVLMLFDPVALLLTSVVSTIIAIVCVLLLLWLGSAFVDDTRKRRDRILRRERMGRPVTKAEMEFALAFTEADDPDYLRLSKKTDFADPDDLDTPPEVDEFDDD